MANIGLLASFLERLIHPFALSLFFFSPSFSSNLSTFLYLFLIFVLYYYAASPCLCCSPPPPFHSSSLPSALHLSSSALLSPLIPLKFSSLHPPILLIFLPSSPLSLMLILLLPSSPISSPPILLRCLYPVLRSLEAAPLYLETRGGSP